MLAKYQLLLLINLAVKSKVTIQQKWTKVARETIINSSQGRINILKLFNLLITFSIQHGCLGNKNSVKCLSLVQRTKIISIYSIIIQILKNVFVLFWLKLFLVIFYLLLVLFGITFNKLLSKGNRHSVSLWLKIKISLLRFYGISLYN